MIRSSLLSLIVALGAPPALAADAAGNYAIWGAGGRSCHQFQRSATDAAARAPFKDFLMGYLTAYNTLAAVTYNALGDMSLEDALGWLDGYCDLHKLDSFDRALGEMLRERHESRTQASSTSGGWGRPPSPDAAAR
jgi:hypothetical protein